MTVGPQRVVFDCVIFAQALINPKGPAGACVTAAECGDCLLHLSPFILQEIRELPAKLPACLAVTPDRIERFVEQILEYSVLVKDVPERYTVASDLKDSAYVNLALATDSELVVTRDHHLLGLMDAGTEDGKAFREQFPRLRVLRPVEFLAELAGRSRA